MSVKKTKKTEKIEYLRSEVRKLRKRRALILKRMGEAAKFGDLRENSSWIQANRDLNVVDSMIVHLCDEMREIYSKEESKCPKKRKNIRWIE